MPGLNTEQDGRTPGRHAYYISTFVFVLKGLIWQLQGLKFVDLLIIPMFLKRLTVALGIRFNICNGHRKTFLFNKILQFIINCIASINKKSSGLGTAAQVQNQQTQRV